MLTVVNHESGSGPINVMFSAEQNLLSGKKQVRRKPFGFQGHATPSRQQILPALEHVSFNMLHRIALELVCCAGLFRSFVKTNKRDTQ